MANRTTDRLPNGTRVTMTDGTGEAIIRFESRDEQGRARYTVYQGRRREHGFVAGLHFEVTL